MDTENLLGGVERGRMHHETSGNRIVGISYINLEWRNEVVRSERSLLENEEEEEEEDGGKIGRPGACDEGDGDAARSTTKYRPIPSHPSDAPPLPPPLSTWSSTWSEYVYVQSFISDVMNEGRT